MVPSHLTDQEADWLLCVRFKEKTVSWPKKKACSEFLQPRSSLRRHLNNPNIDCQHILLPPLRAQSLLPKEKKARNAEHYERSGGKDKQIVGRTKRKAIREKV